MKAIPIVLALAGLAGVTFDSASGTGNANGGTIADAFGWNGTQLVQNAPGVTFAVETVDHYTGVCTTRNRISETEYPVYVSGVVVHDTVGHYEPNFTFTGYGDSFTSGNVPTLHTSCQLSSGLGGTWWAVEKSNSVSGLFATYGADSVLIY
jgi:hypothetical protein